MDQDSFRQLLQIPHASRSTAPTLRGSLMTKVTKVKTVDASQPAFKPRKVKKTESKYRDRAGERRVGEGNDYAQIEAVLEDFEKQTRDAKDKAEIEAKRKYLGGDGGHSILVKGLDFALLEQNKARASLNTDDDESLEKAFQEVASEASTSVPNKRTREGLLRELKEKRIQKGVKTVQKIKMAEEEVRLLEDAKLKGKFKPIGFKAIGSSSEGAKKKLISEGKDDERKKKRRKVERAVSSVRDKQDDDVHHISPASNLVQPLEPEPGLIDEDLDIFAGAGEYEGIELGDEGDGEDNEDISCRIRDDVRISNQEPSLILPRKWIPSEGTDPVPIPEAPTSRVPAELLSSSVPPLDLEEGEEEPPMPLQPLASSALPDIKEFLKMDKAANSYDKNKKRKDKKKGGRDGEDKDEADKKLSAEAKADRDYKRLKSYTDKKGAASGSKQS